MLWKTVRNIKVYFQNGQSNDWQGSILPSVLVMLLVMIGYLYSELDIYQQDQRLYHLSENFYRGKVLSNLAFRQIVAKESDEKSGHILYNIGKVNYSIKKDQVQLDIFLEGQFLFTDYEKINNKKTSLHK